MIIAVLRFSRPNRRGPVPPKAAHSRHALRSARALLLGVLVPALLMVLAAPPVLAQINNWGGDVLVSGSSISVAPGESVTYSVRLNRKPTETDGTTLENEAVKWFVMVHINGVRYQDGEYKDLTLIPSFYRSFTGKHDPSHPNDDGNWDEWKGFRIYRASYDDWEGLGKKTSERATSVTLTHEVWDHNANCPVHRRSPVTVGIGGSTPPPDNNGGNAGNNGNGENGGSSGNGGNRVAPTASISDATGVEGEVLRFEVTLSRSSDTPVTVDYQTAGGTALEGTDYDAASGTLTFGHGATRRTIEVRTRQDTAAEPNETFTVTLRSPSGATLRDAGAVGTIIDDDAPDPAALTVSDATGVEGEVLRFEVTLSRSSDTPVTVDYQTAGGTALEGTDYDAASGTLIFGPGATRRTIEVRTRQDTAAEPNETFTVTLRSPSGATLRDAGAVGTIIDDDAPDPAGPALTVSDATGVEGEVLRFEVTLSRSSDTPVTVDYQTAGGTALEGTDYDAASGTLTFGPGATRQTIEVRTRQDTAAEPNETFTVTLRSPSGATLRDAGAVGTIIDDDAPDPAALTVSDARAREGEVLRFEVTLSRSSDTPVTVDYQTAGGTALEGTDYDAASGTLTFGHGATRRTIEVRTRQDTAAEPNETFTVTLRSPSGATLRDAGAVGTIIDDDAPDPAALTVSDATGVEGEVLRFEVTLSRSSDTPVTVDYQTAGGTALEGTDYDAASGTLTFGPGATRQTVEVRTRQDTAAEPNETFTVTLRSPSGATLRDAGAVGTIIDDDAPDPAGPALTVSDATGVEGEVLRFEVTLSRSSDTPVTVDYQTAGGTALEGTYYDAASGTLTFGPGATRRTIEVRTRQDTAAEPNETFTVTLRSPSGATLRDAGAVGTIIDDDAPDPAGPALTVSDARAREGEILRFRVILTPPGSETVTVDYQTASGTAVEGLDYIAAGGRLTFKPGIAQQTVEIQTRKDDIDESNENLTLWLSNAHGARLQDAVGAGTIIGEVERRIPLVNHAYLPEVGRAIAFNAVRCRIDRALSRAASGNLKQVLDRLAPPPSRSVSIDELLGRLSFALQSTGGANGIGRVSAWSCGDYRALADGKSGGPVDWDGKVVGLQAGADVRLRPDLLAGLAVSRSNGTFRYDVVGDAAEIGGRHRLRLNGLHPYLAWKASPHLTVWGTIGHFWGDLEWADDLEGDRRAGNAWLGSAMLGLNGRLLEHGKTTVRFKGETGLAQFKVADAGVGFGAAVSDLRRLRLAIESAHEQPLPTGGTLRPWGEIGLFHDGGDGETGVGLELGGGLRYRNQAKGWSAEVFGRRRMVHGDALPREWGAGAAFRVDPGPADLGFSAILNQSWGRTGSGVERLWDQGPNDAAPSSLWGGRMELQLGYGFGVLGGHGVLTPHGAVTLGQGSGRAYQWGGRLEVGSGVALSLEAERRETDNAEPEHAIMLRGLLRFHPGKASR